LHDLEHGVHADHPPTTQLTGQGWVLHGCVCDKTGHPLPPKATLRTTDRVCVCEPPPQVLEHADHDDQPLTSQLTGQGCVLHAWDSDKAGHATPPLAAAVMTDRLWDWEPPPHVAEHTPHADQPLITQFTGHGWVLHDCCCVNDGHDRPPLAAGRVTVRVCLDTPPPHVTEHADHADQPETKQSTGHNCVLHA